MCCVLTECMHQAAFRVQSWAFRGMLLCALLMRSAWPHTWRPLLTGTECMLRVQASDGMTQARVVVRLVAAQSLRARRSVSFACVRACHGGCALAL